MTAKTDKANGGQRGISRRSFLKTSAGTAALLAAAGMAFMHRRRSRTVRRSGAAPVTG